MTIIEAMTRDLRDSGLILKLSDWAKGGHNRTYITARGYDRSYAGCRSHQLYWDHNERCLINQLGKGTASYDYLDAVAKIMDAFADEQ